MNYYNDKFNTSSDSDKNQENENGGPKDSDKNQENEKISPKQAFDKLTDLCSQYMHLQATIDNNRAERERIRAQKEVALQRINATKEFLMTLLNRSFDQREKVLQKDFQAIDAAIEAGNMVALAATVQSVNALAASSPFKDLLDTNRLQQQLLNGSEIEI